MWPSYYCHFCIIFEILCNSLFEFKGKNVYRRLLIAHCQGHYHTLSTLGFGLFLVAGPTQDLSFLPLINAINTILPCCNNVRLGHTFLPLTFPLFLEICHVILEKNNLTDKELNGSNILKPTTRKKRYFLPLKNEKRTTGLLWYHSAFCLISPMGDGEAKHCMNLSLQFTPLFQTYSTVSFSQLLKNLQEILYWFWFKNH